MEGTGYTRLIKLLLICTILINCTNEKINGDNTSDSIAEAKKNTVFLQEFIPQNNVINPLNNYILEECWLEQRWNYKNQKLDIRKLPNYRLVLKVNKKDENVFIDLHTNENIVKINSDFGYRIPFLRTIDLENFNIKDSLILDFRFQGENNRKVLLIKNKQ